MLRFVRDGSILDMLLMAASPEVRGLEPAVGLRLVGMVDGDLGEDLVLDVDEGGATGIEGEVKDGHGRFVRWVVVGGQVRMS